MNIRVLSMLSIALLFSCKGSQQKVERNNEGHEIDVELLAGTWYKHPDESEGQIFFKDRSSVPPARLIVSWRFDVHKGLVSITSLGPSDRPKSTEYRWKFDDKDQLKVEGFGSFQIRLLTQDSFKIQ